MASPTSVLVPRSAEVPGYAKVAGIIGLILAIVGVIIPVGGVLFVTPLAIIAGAIALYGHYKGMGIAVLIINVLNLIISPTFWLNIGAGATIANAGSNRFLTYFDTIGVIIMFVLVVRKQK